MPAVVSSTIGAETIALTSITPASVATGPAIRVARVELRMDPVKNSAAIAPPMTGSHEPASRCLTRAPG